MANPEKNKKTGVRLYTRVGDEGYTGVLGRERLPKYDLRPDTYGTVEEASAALGMARALLKAHDPDLYAVILEVQQDLYALMADLATLPEAATRPAWLSEARTARLEALIDQFGEQVEIPPAFIMSGDSQAGAILDLARTIIRRAERLTAKLYHQNGLRSAEPLHYLNRLSSLLFVLARFVDKQMGVEHFTQAKLN